jgi:hypothetical protein
VPALPPPDDLARPLFAYGLLKPGELAFSLVEPFVTRREEASVGGTLWLRDGIPLFDKTGDGRVAGWLLWFDPAARDQAWSAVCYFEPAEQYRWEEAKTQSGEGQTHKANVLAGRKVRAGSAGENTQEWTARQDPVFTEGLAEVRRLVQETALDGVSSQPDTPELWSSFFRLQAGYLLLWSIVERYTALRYGPGLDPGERVKQLGKDPSFREAVAAAGAREDVVVDSRDPDSRLRLRADGTGAAGYFYRVRSNLSHRGKSAFKDAQLVHKAVTELSAAMQILLERQMPAADGALVPASRCHRWADAPAISMAYHAGMSGRTGIALQTVMCAPGSNSLRRP